MVTSPSSAWRAVRSRSVSVNLGQEREALGAQGNQAPGHDRRVRVGGDRRRFRVWIVARKHGLAGSQGPDAGRKDGSLGVGGVAEALERGPLAKRGRAHEELAVQARGQCVPSGAVAAENGDRTAEQVCHRD